MILAKFLSQKGGPFEPFLSFVYLKEHGKMYVLFFLKINAFFTLPNVKSKIKAAA